MVVKVKPSIKYGIIYINSIKLVVDKICNMANVVDESIKNIYLFFMLCLNSNLKLISSKIGIIKQSITEYVILWLNSNILLASSLFDILFGIIK